MSEDDKGKRFLELIDEQNNLQWKILEKLLSLIKSDWKNPSLQKELKSLMENHTKITKEINGLDEKNSLL